MAELSFLEIVQTITAEIALVQPSALSSATDLQTVQLKALVNRAGISIYRRYDWTALQSLKVIQITDAIVTTGNTSLGSAVVTGIPTTVGIVANSWVCSGNTLPQGARVVSVDSGTQVTLDSEATETDTAIALTFAQDTYDFPSDFDRFINRTSWDRTNRWEVLGPDSPQVDEWHRSGIVQTGPRRHARQVGPVPTAYRLWPPPGATETSWETVFEYIQNTWAVSVADVPLSKMTADDDTPLIDSQMLVLEGIWRFLRAKQFAYADQYQEAENYINMRIGNDGGSQTLSMAPRPAPYLISGWNVQDGNFPGDS